MIFHNKAKDFRSLTKVTQESLVHRVWELPGICGFTQSRDYCHCETTGKSLGKEGEHSAGKHNPGKSWL